MNPEKNFDVFRGLSNQPPPVIENFIKKVTEIKERTVCISVNTWLIWLNYRIIKYVARRLVQESKVFKDLIWVVIGHRSNCGLSMNEFQLQIAQRLGIFHSGNDDNGDVDKVLSNKIHARLKNHSFLLVQNGNWALKDLQKMGIPNIRDARYLVLSPDWIQDASYRSAASGVPFSANIENYIGDSVKEGCLDVADSFNFQGGLPTDVFLECFLYLALFGYEISLRSIMLSLYGEGFIGRPCMDLSAILRFGKTLLDELCARSMVSYDAGRISCSLIFPPILDYKCGMELLTEIAKVELGHLYDVFLKSRGCEEFRIKPQEVHRIGFFGARDRFLLDGVTYTRLLTLIISKASSLEIPQHAFEGMMSLRVIIINDSNISSFPSSLACLGDTLKVLSLHNCQTPKSLHLSCLLRGLSQLEILDLSSTQVEQVPDNSFEGLQSLRLLDMSECPGILSLPSSISCLLNIEHLILKNCKSLKVLPSFGQPLEKLQYLNLSGTEMTKIPKHFFHHCMVNLEEIDLSSNPFLTSLPQSIYDLINLKKLNLNYCCGLQNIISVTPRRFFSSIEELNLRACKSLEDFNSVTSIFWDMVPHLKSIDLSENPIVSIIAEKNLPRLKSIALQSNQNLISFDISGTNIEKFLLTEGPCLGGLESLNLEDAKYIHKVSWRSVQGSHAKFNLDLCANNNRFSEWQREGNLRGVFISVESGDIFEHLQESHSWLKGCFLVYVCPRTRLNRRRTPTKPCAAHRYKDIDSMMNPLMPSYERCLEIEQIKTFPKGFTVVLGQTQILSVHDEGVITKLSDFGIHNMNELRRCWVERSKAMTVIFDVGSMRGPIFTNLEKLHISNLPKLVGVCINTEFLTSGFGKLQHLCLEYCPRLVTVFSAGICLESLQELKIRFCPRMKEILSGKVYMKGSLDRLQTLSLFELPMLENIAYSVPLASLTTANIKGCPRLHRIPFHRNAQRNSSKLVVTGEPEWWQQLEWDNDMVKQYIHFNPWSRYRKPAARKALC